MRASFYSRINARGGLQKAESIVKCKRNKKKVMDKDKKDKKVICISVSAIYKFLLVIGIVAVATVVMLLPRTDLFKGSVIESQDVEESTIVIEYLKDKDEIVVPNGSSGVSVSKIGLKVGNGPVEIKGITFELEGTMNSTSFENFYMNLDGEEVQNVEYRKGSQSLFIDLLENPIIVRNYSEIELKADIIDAKSGDTSSLHFSEIIAENRAGNEVTSIGINGSFDPAPLLIGIK